MPKYQRVVVLCTYREHNKLRYTIDMENTGVDTGTKAETRETVKAQLLDLVAKFVEGDQTLGIDVNFGEYLSTKSRKQIERSLRWFQTVGSRIERVIARETYDPIPPLRRMLEHTDMNLLIGDRKIATGSIAVNYLSSKDPEGMYSSVLFERCTRANLGEYRREKDGPRAEDLMGNYMLVTFLTVESSIHQAEVPEQLGSEVKSQIRSLLVSNIETIELSMRGVRWQVEGLLPGKNLVVRDLGRDNDNDTFASEDSLPKMIGHIQRFFTPE